MENGKMGQQSGRRTSLEKILMGAVGFLILISIGLLVGLIVVAINGAGDDHDHDHDDCEPHDHEDHAHPCVSAGCIETANMLFKNMNMSADP